METNDWEARYVDGTTGWDAGRAAPPLQDWVAEAERTFRRALAPGVGRGYDLFELGKVADFALGLDVAPSAKLAFESLHSELPTDTIGYRVDDFFTFSFDEPFDLVWDYTFLCAIDPTLRPRWAERMAELIEPNGVLLALLFPVSDEWGDDGPPFKLTLDEVDALLGETFERTSVVQPARSHENRNAFEWLVTYERVAS